MKKLSIFLTVLCLACFGVANAQSLWSENFEGGSMPSGWTTDGSGSWSVATAVNSTHPSSAGEGTYCAQIMHGTSGAATKLITPEINLSSVNSAELSFMHAQQSWAGDIDGLKVYYRTSSSGTWTQLVEYTDAYASWTTESGIVLPNLSSTYQIAFEYIDNYGYGLGIDDINIVRGASCPAPAGLAVTNNGTTATLTWSSDATQFDVAWSVNPNADPDDYIDPDFQISGTTGTMSSMALDTDYYFWVRANCSANDQSSWAGPVSVHIGYCVPAPTSVDNSGISNVTFGTGNYVVNNNTTMSSSATYLDCTDKIGAVQAGVEASIAITFKTGYTYNTYVWADLNNDLTFGANEVICYGESGSTNPTTLTLNFTIPATQTLGDFRLRIGSADSGLGSDPTAADPCYSSSYGCFQDYTLRVLEAPACLMPAGLALTTDGRTATATWDGTASTYNIDINGTVTNNVTSPYEFNVELSTTYEVMVQANCDGGETSDWTNAFNITTPDCIGGHTIEYTLNDSYGDGWNGNAIQVVEGCGDIIATLTIESGASNSGTLTLCGDYYEFIWVNGQYASETSFTFTEGGTTLFTKPSSISDGMVLYTIGTQAMPKPTGLTAGTPEAHSVALSWTENGTATAWQICVNGDENNLIDVTGRPSYTLDRLAADTDYSVKVRAYIDATLQSCWSDEITVHTAEACVKPTSLAEANITINGADLSWEGTNDSYVLQYRPWLSAGEDVQPTSDVMVSASYDLSGFTGNGSVVIRHYNCYNQFALIVDDIVVKNASSEVVFSEDFESCGGNMPSVFTNMDMDGDGHTWEIAASPTMKVNGSYGLASYSYDNDTYSILYPNNWLIINNIPMGGEITFNYCAQDGDWAAENFCVYVSTEESIVEVPVELTSYQVTNLEPNTPYAWQVKGVCGDEESVYVSSFFQTLNDVIFFQTAGNWNVAANWDVNRVPTVDDKVQIDAAAVIPEGVIAYAKTTTMGAAGSITIEDGGQLKQGTNNINVTVQKTITGVGEENWNSDNNSGYYFIATPVGTTLFSYTSTGWGYAQNLYNSEGTFDLYSFDPTQDLEWYNYKANTGDFTKLFANQGYLYANMETTTLNFIGTTTVKSLDKTVVEDFTYDANSTDDFNGWALVGNPFTCNAYINYVDADGDALEANFYTMDPVNGYTLSASNVSLAPCTGALINYSATGKVQYSTEAPAGNKTGMINMTLSCANKNVDQARVRFGHGYNMQHKSFRNNSKVYMPVDGQDYAVVYTEGNNGEMPVSFKAEENGTYTLSFNTENVELGYLHLIDNMNGNEVDLLSTPSYTFEASTTDYASRFKLVFATGNADDNFAFYSNGSFVINNEGNATLQVIDINGRILKSESINGCTNIDMNTAAGVYMLRLVNGDNVKVQKVVVR